MIRFAVVIAAACATLCGCATTHTPNDASQDDRVFTTGSHLPTRAGTGTSPVTTLQAPTFDQVMRGQVSVGGPPSSAP